MANPTNAVDMKIEVIVLPVSDVERAKKFYVGLGWRLDGDFKLSESARLIQMTPPGSQCSVHLGKGITTAAPGSMPPVYLVVSDLGAARADLSGHGVAVSEPFHRGKNGATERGPDPKRESYNSFAEFMDPDGNRWLLQEITQRLPGRVEAETEFSDSSDLASALRRAASAHGRHEERVGARDENWPDWYAKFMVSEQSGEAPPQ
jgi:catechol 2,3-dioxygenase-like lactoylglutathione lyase family enzyme